MWQALVHACYGLAIGFYWHATLAGGVVSDGAGLEHKPSQAQ